MRPFSDLHAGLQRSRLFFSLVRELTTAVGERETHRTKFNQIKVCDHRVSAEPGAWYQLADTQFVVAAAAAAAVMVMAVVAAVVKRRWKVTTKAV